MANKHAFRAMDPSSSGIASKGGRKHAAGQHTNFPPMKRGRRPEGRRSRQPRSCFCRPLAARVVQPRRTRSSSRPNSSGPSSHQRHGLRGPTIEAGGNSQQRERQRVNRNETISFPIAESLNTIDGSPPVAFALELKEDCNLIRIISMALPIACSPAPPPTKNPPPKDTCNAPVVWRPAPPVMNEPATTAKETSMADYKDKVASCTRPPARSISVFFLMSRRTMSRISSTLPSRASTTEQNSTASSPASWHKVAAPKVRDGADPATSSPTSFRPRAATKLVRWRWRTRGRTRTVRSSSSSAARTACAFPRCIHSSVK